eukprot:scaffold159709_cov24-Tisochrysis_lutea.AAC.1
MLVSNLEGRAEALRAAVAERQRLENLTLEDGVARKDNVQPCWRVQTRGATVVGTGLCGWARGRAQQAPANAGSRAGGPEPQGQGQKLTWLSLLHTFKSTEVCSLHTTSLSTGKHTHTHTRARARAHACTLIQVAMLAPEALQLASLREQHAALQRDKAEASLLACDSQLLRVQAAVLRQLQLQASKGGISGEGDDRVGDGAGAEGMVVEAQAHEMGALLEDVFKRMRALEAEQLGQKVRGGGGMFRKSTYH